ncbi:MAG: cytochrome C [Betaproteobacteria bacterium]
MKAVNNVMSAALIALTLIWQFPARAQDADNVRGMAATCANCHAAEGRVYGAIPPIGARDRNTLLQQLKDFKSGVRPATVMHQLARGFTDTQLEQLAAYFAQANSGNSDGR